MRVIITGALLAESAAVVDNKLDVTGGVVDTFRAGADRVARTTLVALTQSEPFDKTPSLGLRITDPAGEFRDVRLEVPAAVLGGEIGFVCYPLGIPVPTDGRYVLSVSGRDGSVSLPLKVSS